MDFFIGAFYHAKNGGLVYPHTYFLYKNKCAGILTRVMERIIFVSIFALIIIFVSLFSAHVFSSGLNLSAVAKRNTTLPALFVPLLYILSLIAIRSTTSALGAITYYFMNVIAGIFFYIFIGALFLGFAIMFGMIFKYNVSSSFAAVVFAVSILLALAGLIQARFMKVSEYTVALEDIPESWNGRRGLLVADTHFGIINKGKFSDKVVNKIISLKPDFVLHAGDFYDGPEINTEPSTESWKKLTAVVPVFYAPGNHEAYGNYTDFIASIRKANVTVLEDSYTIYGGVQIAGLNYRDRGKIEETRQALQKMNLKNNVPTILITHPPTFHNEAALAGTDLMVSGHTHRGQFWPMNFFVRLIYGKYTYGKSSYGNLQTLTTSGVGTFGPPYRLFNTPELVIINFIKK